MLVALISLDFFLLILRLRDSTYTTSYNFNPEILGHKYFMKHFKAKVF